MYRGTSAGFSDDQEFSRLETVSNILRTSHLQRGHITGVVLRDRSNLRRVTGDMHLWVRVLSYLKAGEVMMTFRVSKRLLSYQYCNVLWKMVYVCQSPLKYSTRLQEVGHLLMAPLDGSGFDVHELEERERYFDLYVVLSVCGFYRVLHQSEQKQDWPAHVTESTSAFAYMCGKEIASSLKGVYGSFLEALPAIWTRLFYSPVPIPRSTTVGIYSLTSHLCTEKGCAEVHYRPPLLMSLLMGISDHLGFGISFAVTAEGCKVTVTWTEAPQPSRHTQHYIMRPNVMFYTKSVNLLNKLIEENGAGVRSLDKFVNKLLSGTQSGLRKTPAEIKKVVCRHCKEEVSSFDYASQHSQSRCLRSATESSSLARSSSYDSSSLMSNNSTPMTPCVPTPRGVSQRSPVGSIIEPTIQIFSPPPTPMPSSFCSSHTQAELESQLRERRMQFFTSILSSMS